MKKLVLSLILCFSIFCNTGCAFIILSALLNSDVSETVTNPDEYGNFHDDVEIPSYYPGSLDGYTVNDYCYVIEKSSYLCYEVYLDITVPAEAFSGIIAAVNADSRAKTVKNAYHAFEYKDIIFSDYIDFALNGYTNSVNEANIEKVIYNESESRIIFALLYIEKNSYYDVNAIQYFAKLNIDIDEYLSQKNNEF